MVLHIYRLFSLPLCIVPIVRHYTDHLCRSTKAGKFIRIKKMTSLPVIVTSSHMFRPGSPTINCLRRRMLVEGESQ